MSQLAQRKRTVDKWRELERKIADITELIPLAEEDASLGDEIQAEIETVASRLDELELETAFSSEYDARRGI